jgi:hypothetical protein
MNKPLSVNELLDHLPDFVGRDVSVRGILHYRFEDVAVYHSPTSEQRSVYASSIWIDVGWGSLQFNDRACEAMDGKIVIVEGTLQGPDPSFGGCGHMSLWPAAILARMLERDKR